MSKASNLLAILWLLQARPSMTAAEIAERLDGELRFLVDPIGVKHLPSYLLTFGPALQIREPAHLRKAVANLARELATHTKRSLTESVRDLFVCSS